MKKAYSDDWVYRTLLAIRVRDEITYEWKKRGITKGLEYAILTNEIT